MSFQLQSRMTKGRGHSPDGGVIAVFHFPTNISTLDGQDLEILEAVANYMRPHVIVRRMELSIVGHADHRGDRRYNHILASRRAHAVAKELKDRLRGLPNFSVHSIISSGEHYARKNAQNASALAHDRRVEVWDKYPDDIFSKIPEIRSVEKFHRLISIGYNLVDFEPVTPSGREDLAGKAIKRWTTILLEKALGVYSKYGEVTDRKYKKMSASFRVNYVYISQKHYVRATEGGVYTSYDTDIKYTWGAPKKQVVIKAGFRSDTQLGKKSRTKVITMARRKADTNPFTFPPPKEFINR